MVADRLQEVGYACQVTKYGKSEWSLFFPSNATGSNHYVGGG